jgi:hypothetical protein
MAVDDVYILGAGASYVHGAPLTDQILPYALALSPNRQDPRLALIRRFLNDVFQYEVPATKRGGAPGRVDRRSESATFTRQWAGVPSLVDVLSVVDVALDRKESLARGYDVEQLRRVRTALEFAIFDALEDSLKWSPSRGGRRRSTATHTLARRLSPETAAVISFNYDVIADIALAMRAQQFDFARADLETLGVGDYQTIDYGVDFANVEDGPATRPRFRLFKLHGSFNWLRSRLTGNLYFGGMRKAVGLLFRTPAEREAGDLWRFFRPRTGSGRIPDEKHDLESVLITPTHLKDLRNPHIARIWRRAEECLRTARRITFIGYSLPGDDLHVKYLLKRALQTRPQGAPPPRIVVVDKGDARSSPVRASYERFFGKKLVRYHGEGFEAWLDRLRPGAYSLSERTAP